MKKGTIYIIGLLFIALGLCCIYFYNTELRWRSAPDLKFMGDEQTKLSLMVIGNQKLLYDFYENSEQSGVRKQSDEVSYVTIGKPYWLSSIINDTRKEYPITKFRHNPGILIKDSYTNEVYFIRWDRELARRLCDIIKDDEMAKSCSKYKDYIYKDDNFLKYQDDRKELRIDKEIYINGNIYEIEEDDLIFKRENNTTKILPQKFNEKLDKLIYNAIESGNQSDNLTENMIRYNGIFYNLDLNNDSVKELSAYFSKIEGVNNNAHKQEEQIIEDTYTDYTFSLEGNCIDVLDYNYTENSVINVYNIYLNNKPLNLKYQLNANKQYTKVFINNNEVVNRSSLVPILNNVCVYNNYLIYKEGYEGPETYTIINENGSVAHSFIGKSVNYDNGILHVEEINKNDLTNPDDNKLETYDIDLTKDIITKNNLTVNDYPCDKEGPMYDC